MSVGRTVAGRLPVCLLGLAGQQPKRSRRGARWCRARPAREGAKHGAWSRISCAGARRARASASSLFFPSRTRAAQTTVFSHDRSMRARDVLRVIDGTGEVEHSVNRVRDAFRRAVQRGR